MSTRVLVSVVDDDESVRESVPELLRQCGFAVGAFASAADFLASDALDQVACLILDIEMPVMSGIELQGQLARRGRSIPIVFITAHRAYIDRLRLLQGEAVTCLLKPFSETQLLEAVTAAVALRRS